MRESRPPTSSIPGATNHDAASIRRYVERRAGVAGGEPVIIETRISARDVVLYWREYGDIERIVAALRIPEDAIRAALTYYKQHRGEIDEYIRQDDEAGEAIEREERDAPGVGG